MPRPVLAGALALSLLPAGAQAQGLLDRFVHEIAPAAAVHDTSPSALAATGVFVYDPRSDLANMDLDALLPGPHMLVLTHLSGGEPHTYEQIPTGLECAALAMSITRTHRGAGWAYCHPFTPPATPSFAPADLPPQPPQEVAPAETPGRLR